MASIHGLQTKQLCSHSLCCVPAVERPFRPPSRMTMLPVLLLLGLATLATAQVDLPDAATASNTVDGVNSNAIIIIRPTNMTEPPSTVVFPKSDCSNTDAATAPPQFEALAQSEQATSPRHIAGCCIALSSLAYCSQTQEFWSPSFSVASN